MGSLSVWHWLIVLAIVVLVFGTCKLKNMGKVLGGAIKGFKEGMKEGDDDKSDAKKEIAQDKTTVDVEAKDGFLIRKARKGPAACLADGSARQCRRLS